jgi:azurin
MKKSRLIVLTAAGLLISGAALAADQCSTEIEGNDAMQYNKSSIDVPASCKNFTVTLKHVGKATKAAMGHDWVLTTPADMQPVILDAMKAGAANDYEKPGDTRVIARTKMIGGGETTSVTFPVSKLKPGEAYSYFCTFPGHAAIMKGTLTVK